MAKLKGFLFCKVDYFLAAFLGMQQFCVWLKTEGRTDRSDGETGLADSPLLPSVVRQRLHRMLDHAGCERVRFHDLRHPYVKHTTKILACA